MMNGQQQFYGGMVPQPQMYPGMVQWAPQQFATVTMTNPLDNIQERLRTGSAKAIQITQEALDQAICTHRDQHRLYLEKTNNPNDPEEQVCQICGAIFTLVDQASPEQVHAVIKDCIDTLETAKVMYVNIPENLCREIFQIIAVLKQIDKLWGIASEQYQKFANPLGAAGNVNQYGNTMGLFNQLVGGVNPFQQQMSPMTMGQPMMPAQQVVPAQYAAPPVMPQAAPVPMMTPMAPVAAAPMMPTAVPQQGTVAQPQSIYPGMPAAPNMQAQMMTQAAPGVASNGFGVPEAPTNVTPQQQAPANVPADVPQVTKQLQA